MTFYKPQKSQTSGLPGTKKAAARRNSRKINWKIWFFGFILILVAGGFFYLLFMAPIFKIKRIEVSGGSVLGDEEIKAAARQYLEKKFFNLVPGDRLPAVNSQKMAEELENSFVEIAGARVKKILPDKLDISIDERKAAAVWCQTDNLPQINAATTTKPVDGGSRFEPISLEGDNCFFIDGGGIAYMPAPQLSGSLMPIFFSQNAVGPRAQALPPKTLSFAITVKKELQKTGLDLVGFIDRDSVAEELAALTNEGWLVFFDTTRPASKQASVLAMLLAGELKDRKNLQYVDMRIVDRVYYK